MTREAFLFPMSKVIVIDPRQPELVKHLCREGPLSRWQLHQRTGLPPTGGGTLSLKSVDDAAGARPVLLENGMPALAARWLLTHGAQADQEVLLVSIDDGRLGAAILSDGRPNRGCAIGGNELGHTRF